MLNLAVCRADQYCLSLVGFRRPVARAALFLANGANAADVIFVIDATGDRSLHKAIHMEVLNLLLTKCKNAIELFTTCSP